MNLIAKEYKCFENIKKLRSEGTEYWCTRDLASVLNYSEWEISRKVIKRPMIACTNSGHDIDDRFSEVRKMVSAEVAPVPKRDFEPTRYACCLIIQNGDPRKEVRKAIEEIGGTLPEDLPTPQKSIAQIGKEQIARLKEKAESGQLMLDE